MQYEAPELIALPALDLIHNALQAKSTSYSVVEFVSPLSQNEANFGYADWE